MKKPLLSWRVAILPHVEQKPLYDRFKLDEPWDSPHNKTLIPLMPRVYRSPFAKVESGKTTYVLATGPKLLFGTAKAKGIRDVVDTSNTILAFDVDDASAVTWTKPDDWEYDAKTPTRGLFRGATRCRRSFATAPARLIAARTPPGDSSSGSAPATAKSSPTIERPLDVVTCPGSILEKFPQGPVV